MRENMICFIEGSEDYFKTGTWMLSIEERDCEIQNYLEQVKSRTLRRL